MERTILEKVDKILGTNNKKRLLYLAYTGSKLYGTQTDTSDIDGVAVYLDSPESYVGLYNNKRSNIQKQIELDMVEHTIYTINGQDFKYYILDEYNGIKQEVCLDNKSIMLWYDDKENYSLWFYIDLSDKSNVEIFDEYLSNKIGILDVMEVGKVYLIKKYYNKYNNIIVLSDNKITLKDNLNFPDNMTLGYNFFEYINSKKKILDITLYEFRHYMRLLANNNPNILETLYIPDNKIIYIDTIFNKLVTYNAHEILSLRAIENFRHYINGQIIRIKNKVSDKSIENIKKLRKDTYTVIRLISEINTILKYEKLIFPLEKETMLLIKSIKNKDIDELINECNKLIQMKDKLNKDIDNKIKKSSIKESPNIELINDITKDIIIQHVIVEEVKNGK